MKNKFRIIGILLMVLLSLSVAVPAFAKGQSLAFTESAATMQVGESRTFRVNREDVTWKSSNPDVATVSAKGKVTAKQNGTTRITAASGEQRVVAKVKVKDGYTIGIDAGHQQSSNAGVEPIGPGSSTNKTKVSGGTRGVSTGKPEYQLTLEIAQRLEKELTDRGYKVVMTRETNDVDISNAERAKLLNGECDIAIRLHADGASGAAHGASALYPSASNPYVGGLSAASQRLSECVLNSYCEATGISNRGLSLRDDLTGTNWSTIPVTLIEMGFMTNTFDDEYMSSENGQQKMAEGLANGIDSYFAAE